MQTSGKQTDHKKKILFLKFLCGALKQQTKESEELNMGIDIYRKGCFETDLEQKFEAIEKALGFQLFFWQKCFIERGTFRQTGATTAEILRDLLQTDAQPLDYTKYGGRMAEFYKDQTRDIKEQLDNAGIETRTVFFSRKDKEEYIENQRMSKTEREAAEKLKRIANNNFKMKPNIQFNTRAAEVKASGKELNMNDEAMNQPTAESVIEAAEAEDTTAAARTMPEELPNFLPPADLAADITTAIFEKTYLPGYCFEAANDCIFHLIMEKAEGRYISVDMPEIKRDWKAAENAVNDILSKYAPSGYMGKAIYPVLMPLKERLESGERTADLFNAIVEATR